MPIGKDYSRVCVRLGVHKTHKTHMGLIPAPDVPLGGETNGRAVNVGRSSKK
jgi:hypothetical protein